MFPGLTHTTKCIRHKAVSVTIPEGAKRIRYRGKIRTLHSCNVFPMGLRRVLLLHASQNRNATGYKLAFEIRIKCTAFNKTWVKSERSDHFCERFICVAENSGEQFRGIKGRYIPTLRVYFVENHTSAEGLILQFNLDFT